jgi:anion-transporting  ArsA/GET3 family ATPase
VKTALAGYGFSENRLLEIKKLYEEAEESALIDQVTAKHLEQKKESGEAQEATEARDRKLDELASRISGLRAVAKVALDENPQMLEKLGILARKAPKS